MSFFSLLYATMSFYINVTLLALRQIRYASSNTLLIYNSEDSNNASKEYGVNLDTSVGFPLALLSYWIFCKWDFTSCWKFIFLKETPFPKY